MWKIEGALITYEKDDEDDYTGARYLKQFSAEFPHFEVSNNTL